ncbi:predicted protein [Chaetoceros tenuissimus]|uniref:Uncharacterized protein n=1 Tax=Chaetoceros tenuissimus TaxID=426638 RepID=A0AAD3CDW3_9STRA|nr:predicted protein [Chaetoceros tenuissimus]
MCIDVIHEIFPGAEVEWERTERVQVPMMTVDETKSGKQILTFDQNEMSDDMYGPSVDMLRQKLKEIKNTSDSS